MKAPNPYALKIEATLADLVAETCVDKPLPPILGVPPFNEALSPALVAMHLPNLQQKPKLDHVRSGFRSATEYYCVDFLDLIDFATSRETDQPPAFRFRSNGVVYVDSLRDLQRGFDWESEEKGISLKGCAVVSQYEEKTSQQHVVVIAQVTWNPKSEHPDADQFFFCLHLLVNEDGEYSEFTRSHIYPPVNAGAHDEPHISFAGRMWEDPADWWAEVIADEGTPDEVRSNLRSYLRTVERSKDWLYQGMIGEIFEVARLILFLPKYVEFMYDLVQEERRAVGGVEKTSYRHGKTKKVIAFPEYRIIKSIRVRLEESVGGESATRSWSAPSHRFAVKGHWRLFSNPDWTGHDPEGNTVKGRTWVSSFEKGADVENAEEEVVQIERDPRVVVKIKQTLAFGRDSVRAAKISKESPSEEGGGNESALVESCGEHDEARIERADRPSNEWRYEERRKLTAGLRYFILRRDDFRCVLCGRDASDGVKLEVDHILPVVEWGKTEESNLRVLCRDCNIGRVRH